MAKLTRTQKFADLRETLAHDKEPSLSTKELSDYEDKFNNLTGQTLEDSSKKEVRKVPEEDPKYIWEAFEDTPVDDYEIDLGGTKSGSDFYNSELYVWNDLQEMPKEKKKEAPVVQEPVQQVAPEPVQPVVKEPVKEVVPEPVQPVVQEFVEPFKQPEVVQAPVQETVVQPEPQIASFYEEEKVEPAPVVNEPVVDTAPAQPEQPHYMGLYNANPEIEAAYEEAEKRAAELEASKKEEETAKIDNTFETTLAETLSVDKILEETLSDKKEFENVVIGDDVKKTEDIVKQANETVEEIVSEKPESLVQHASEDRHEADHSNDEVNHIINQTIDEVSEYNKATGEQTISQLTNNMVNEVRRRETRSEKHQYSEAPLTEKSEDSEFSNTVSMEITKIMDEVSSAKQETETPKVEEVKPVVEEHPVLTKALEEEKKEDVVEIKNIAEVEKEATRDTLSGTIPFVVSASEDEELIDDDVEEDSNTILNIILIVLIVILVAVLGLIIFYILKTKGII